MTLVESDALRQAIKLDVANARKNGMRDDVRREKGTEACRTMIRMNDNVEHESLEDAVCEDAGESQKLLCVGCCDGETKSECWSIDRTAARERPTDHHSL